MTKRGQNSGKEIRQQASNLKKKIQEAEIKLRVVEAKYRNVLDWVPNMASSDTPIGESEADNVEWCAWSPDRMRLMLKKLKQQGVPTSSCRNTPKI